MEGPTTQPAHPTHPTPPRQRGNRRRGHGPRNHTQNRPQPQPQEQPSTQSPFRPPAGHSFGAALTRLQPDAPTFVPASVAPRSSTSSPSRPPPQRRNPPSQATPASQRPRKVSLSRSIAPDIATRTQEDIEKGIYECAICTNEVSRSSKVWSCRTCWTVFHIGCIKKWSKNEGSAVHRPAGDSDGEVAVGKQWRCPGCNLPKDVVPSAYMCWCEKEMDPKVMPGMPPHSCGQSCGRERTFPKSCPHPCDLVCHAGPCPPCTAIGPEQSCFCGKKSTRKRCVETNYAAGWSCGSVCGDTMPCGEHQCQRPCHEGLCGACPIEIEAKCYCGKVEKKIQCSDAEEEKESYEWTGKFDCHQICDRLLDCGLHKCEQMCHPQDQATPHCSRSPDMVTHCPCGKTSLSSLNTPQRTSCRDSIPSCQKPCGKPLACGHACTQICHTGECLPCLQEVSITCRCGRNSFQSICHQGTIEPPQCFRTCKATMNCGRHECGERCCQGERKANERQATKRKLKPLGGAVTRILDESIEAEHICTRVCGRQLKCGNHTCADLCHRGPCGSCKEAIFDDISCNCGRTVLQAPLPCGTKPPPCSFPCRRPTECGHPQVAHNCHSDAEQCPKCPFLTEKQCLCAKKTLKNQACWREDVLCGLICGKTLKCGSHTCRKTCHRTGECEDANQHCQQECGKAKKTCGHPCEQPCHAPAVCKEQQPCPFRVMITCDCQRKKEEVKCNAKAAVPDPPSRQNSLKCDEECARLARNRSLALALHISDDHTDDHVPYSTTTLKMYLEDVAWAHKQEEILRLFAADDQEKRFRFNPMKPGQRAFIHSIAEDFGFDGESLDPEPHRHVLLFKTPKFVSAPMKTLAQAARIKRAQLNISAPVHASTPVERKPIKEIKHNYNGFLLNKSRFALTEVELRPIIRKAAPTTEFDIIFISSNDSVALLPSQSAETTDQLTTLLTSLQPTISSELTKSGLAASAVLCTFDTAGLEPRVTHQQGQLSSSSAVAVSAGGWSQVAAKGAPAMQAPRVEPVGQRPVYTVLGSRLAEAKKKKLENEQTLRQKKKVPAEVVVDDWEQEVERDETEPKPDVVAKDEHEVGKQGDVERVFENGSDKGDRAVQQHQQLDGGEDASAAAPVGIPAATQSDE